MSKHLLKSFEEKLSLEERSVLFQLEQIQEKQADENGLPEAADIGTISWQADVNSSFFAIKDNLIAKVERIRKALIKIRNGSYGLCEKCKMQINHARLEVIPSASTCGLC